MECPNCGAKIEEGSLYCQFCGEDIHIVPDFEPEIENSINEILTSVAGGMDQVVETSTPFPQEDKNDLQQKKDHLSYRLLLGIGGGFLLLIVVLAIVGAVMGVRYNSVDYQLSKATSCMSDGNYESACGFYERVLELDANNSTAKLSLAQAYLELGRREEALVLLKEVVALDLDNDDERESAGNLLVELYTEDENYQEINDFFLDCGEDEVINLFQKYMARVPEFSYLEGTYEEVIPLKLSANTSGKIYYTMDGSQPSEKSDVYTAPIFLETGDYLITAYFVNDFGIASDTVKSSYHIDIPITYAPEVSAYSGEYTTPTLIEVEVPEGSVVYYTVDNSEPNVDSIKYSGPIPMPIGKSKFKFVTYNKEGISGETTSRNYDLELATDVSTADAEHIITQTMFDAGKIYDMSGLSYEIYGRYVYQFQYVINIPEEGDFYIIAEIYVDTENIQTKTGTLFAVGVYDGVRYRVNSGPDGTITVQDYE